MLQPREIRAEIDTLHGLEALRIPRCLTICSFADNSSFCFKQGLNRLNSLNRLNRFRYGLSM
jgi:hypothetical protein